jgi:type II secretory pathway component PulC
MPLITRSTLLSRLPFVVLFAALSLLMWVLAHWTWAFLTPHQQPQVAASSAPLTSKFLAEKTVGFHLFGSAMPPRKGEESVPMAAASNISVRGIYASKDGRSGFAALVLDGHSISAVPGKEFAPGMVLQRVYADHVEILRGGQVETVRMPTAAISTPNTATPGTNPAAPPADPGALQLVVQELGPQRYGFSRAQMLETLKRADQLPLLGRFGPYPRGGAVLEQSPTGGLPEKLGLKVGDIVIAINEKSLAGPGDVARFYERLVQSESVNVVILRAGEKMNLNIQVTP